MTDKLCTKDISLIAAYLSVNVSFLIKELSNQSGETNFSRTGNTIIYMVLPGYTKGVSVENELSITSALHEVALIKLMHEQTMLLIGYISKKDPFFADWSERLIVGFLKDAAMKFVDRRSAYNVETMEFVL